MSTGGLPSTLQSSGSGPQPDQWAAVRPFNRRYAESESDTEDMMSEDDSLQDSSSYCASTSSASSVSGDDDGLEHEQELNFFSTSSVGISDLECLGDDFKKRLKGKSLAIEPFPDPPSRLPSPDNMQDGMSKESLGKYRSDETIGQLLSVPEYSAQVARAAGAETMACFPLRSFPRQGSYNLHRGSANNSQDAQDNNHEGRVSQENYIPVPPHLWTTRTRKQTVDGGFGESTRGRDRNGTRNRRQIACPAAKGKPFDNLACLGLCFPNLAKTRQHLGCKSHYNVSTPNLPDGIRDPNGWDEIQKLLYPNQEVPSSEDDFAATMDLIKKWGEGPGKPDFRSTLMRLIEKAGDPNLRSQMLRDFEEVDPEIKEDREMYMEQPSTSLHPSLSTAPNFQSGMDTDSPPTSPPQILSDHNTHISPNPPPYTFPPTIANTPASAPFTDFSRAQGSTYFDDSQLYSFNNQPDTMGANNPSPDAPNLQNQTDNEPIMGFVGGPSRNSPPQVYASFQKRFLTFQYDFPAIENWIRGLDPRFFERYNLIAGNGVVQYDISSMELLKTAFDMFWGAGNDMFLEVTPKHSI
ncbi:hypothetical protein TWF718_004577 [Orbilia javanica]|uniref:Uncharacterized protein n=1 Tax=Orbilia javanica TaxID=47235 RepID=A0AAN8RQH4_9PEZI